MAVRVGWALAVATSANLPSLILILFWRKTTAPGDHGLEPGSNDRITGRGRVIAFGNRLIYGYASVSSQIVWGIVSAGVPALPAEGQSIMGES